MIGINISVLITIVVSLTFLPSHALSGSQGSKLSKDEIFAIVNSEAISKKYFSEIVAFRNSKKSIFHSKSQNHSADVRLREKASWDIISRTLLVQEAERSGVRPKGIEIRENFNTRLEGFGGRQKFGNYLTSSGVSWKTYEKMTNEAFIANYYIKKELAKRISISENSCKEYYQEHINEYNPKSSADVSIVKISLLSETDEKTISTIRGLQSIKTWDELRRRANEMIYSNPGRIDGRIYNHLKLYEIEGDIIWKAISDMDENSAAYVKENVDAHYLVFLHKLTAPPKTSFQEAKDNIRQKLLKKELDLLVIDTIRGLRKKADIKLLIDPGKIHK